MSDLSDVCCTLCSADMMTVFGGATPTRTQLTISGNQTFSGPCVVADEITFQTPSMLIFNPGQQQDQVEFAIICRKLTVQGGKAPIDSTPCNPQDPGSRYGNTNAITWQGRIQSAAAGASIPAPAPQPAGSGLDGTNGMNGNQGSNGASPAGGGARDRAIKLVLVAFEVVNNGNLVIDWAGQNGGAGGDGQLGGNGGTGAAGADGVDEGWPGSGCQSPTGAGGSGGNGGSGGAGGNGGNGGQGGQIIVISTPQNIASAGVVNDPTKFTFVTSSTGGAGGNGAHGGLGAPPGEPGKRSSNCGPASHGTTGSSSVAVFGADGTPGAGGSSPTPNPVLEALTAGQCADNVPSPLIFAGSNVLPQSFRRCSSGSGIGTISLTGQYFDQIASVATSLAGVTATINAATRTDTHIDVDLVVSATSASGLGNLIFTYTYPSTTTQPLNGAIQVNICAANTITPVTGYRSTSVPVTIKGIAFDTTAPVHTVTVSGLGVTVSAGSVMVIDDLTLTCTLVIDATAPLTTRDVIVTAGTIANPCQSTISQSFTVV